MSEINCCGTTNSVRSFHEPWLLLIILCDVSEKGLEVVNTRDKSWYDHFKRCWTTNQQSLVYHFSVMSCVYWNILLSSLYSHPALTLHESALFYIIPSWQRAPECTIKHVNDLPSIDHIWEELLNFGWPRRSIMTLRRLWRRKPLKWNTAYVLVTGGHFENSSGLVFVSPFPNKECLILLKQPLCH